MWGKGGMSCSSHLHRKLIPAPRSLSTPLCAAEPIEKLAAAKEIDAWKMLARTLGVNVQSSGGGPRNIEVMSTQSFAWSEASRVCGQRKMSLYRNRRSRSVTYLELVPALVRECALVHVRWQAFEEPDWNVSVRE